MALLAAFCYSTWGGAGASGCTSWDRVYAMLRARCRITNADIKDKQPLLDTRKSIERDMERFKACEREMKQAGRGGTLKPADPREKAKEDVKEWLGNALDSLQAKVGCCMPSLANTCAHLHLLEQRLDCGPSTRLTADRGNGV
jgi:hypothetical protein